MAKSSSKVQTYFVCSNCGKKSLKYMGKCPACAEWNTMEEVTERPEPAVTSRGLAATAMRSAPQRLREVSTEEGARYPISVEEFSRVLGGGLVPGSLTLLGGDPGIGKCLTADTRILNPITGDYVSIVQWAEEQSSVLSLDENALKLGVDSTVAFYERGIQPIVEVKTKLGRTLRCTPSHPVFTPSGWRPVGELSVGDYLASPRELPYFGSEPMPEAEVKLIAYILSDGSAQSAIAITSMLPEVAEDAAQIAQAFGMGLKCYARENNRALQFRFTNNVAARGHARRDFAAILRKAQKYAGISWAEWSRQAEVDYDTLNSWRRGECSPNEGQLQRLADVIAVLVEDLGAEARNRAEAKTPIARFLERVGVRFSKAATKKIPDCIFRLPREQLALFLKTLYTCDGSVYTLTSGQPAVSYSTISHQLAEDVQHLLLRFGIVSKLRIKQQRVNETPYSSYEVTFMGVPVVQKFLSQIGIMGRAEARAKIAALPLPQSPSTQFDMIPTGEAFWEHFNNLRGDMTFREVSKRAGTKIVNRRHERPLCRTTVRKLAAAFDDPYLSNLANGDVYWDEIVSTTPAGEEAVYDISVEKHPSFVANDLIVHNSTILLSIAALFAQQVGKVLYVSGEESVRQIKMRAERLNLNPEELYLVTETNLDTILDHVAAVQPLLLIVDSIQTTFTDEKPSSAGTVSQVRECATRLQMLAKTTGVSVFLVGHVTKDGTIAGPRVLEHIVDTVLYLEGDPFHAYRLLRSVKNRFGATNEVGVFEMRGEGMVEVTNPSEAFLAERVVSASGSSIVVTMEGTRPLLVEVQALASQTAYPNPRRTGNGVDFNRLQLLIAVLTRRIGLRLAEQDVFVNVIGGMTIDEPAADLAIAIAIASSVWDKSVPADLAIIGEVGLSGELRAVAQLPARLREASKLGFKRCLIPKMMRRGDPLPSGIEAISVRSVMDALTYTLPMDKQQR